MLYSTLSHSNIIPGGWVRQKLLRCKVLGYSCFLRDQQWQHPSRIKINTWRDAYKIYSLTLRSFYDQFSLTWLEIESDGWVAGRLGYVPVSFCLKLKGYKATFQNHQPIKFLTSVKGGYCFPSGWNFPKVQLRVCPIARNKNTYND